MKKNPYAVPLCKWEREHAAECIEAIKAGYDWTKGESCWFVTKRGIYDNAGETVLSHLLETNTRLSAAKYAVQRWKAEQAEKRPRGVELKRIVMARHGITA